jgi:hypothetical protein
LAAVPARRFPTPWSVEEQAACFVVQDVMELRTEDDIGPYKRHELLTGTIYYPALGYSGYGDGKSTHIADFVTHEMRLDWLANRDRLLAFWKSGEPISKFFPDSKPWLLDRGDPDSLPWAEQVFGDGGEA